MKSSQYSHRMQRVIDGIGYEEIDIEDEFPGLRYLKATGLNDIGAAKNLYTEEYADSDRIRVYLPPDGNYANQGTTVKMTFIVIGDAERRQQTMTDFFDYVRKGIHRYADTARRREFDFIVKDEISVSEEKWHGSHPYVEFTITLQNLNGCTRPYRGVNL